MSDNGQFDVDKRCIQIKAVEARIKEMEDEFAAGKIKELKELRDKLRGSVLQWLLDNKTQNIKTKSGYTPYQIRKINYRVEDQAAFRDNIVNNALWGMVYWGKAIADGVKAESLKLVQAQGYSSVEAWQVANKADPFDDPPLPPVPPGIKPDQELTLGLKSPPKPKTEGEKTPVKSTPEVSDVETL